VSAIALDWLLAFYVWKGIRRRGVTVASLVGGSWGTPRAILRDLAIAAAFWGVFLSLALATHAVLGRGDEKSLDILLPRTALEIAVWIATSVTAGLCEEFVFRGYVQRQCAAWSRSAAVAIVGQGLVFGVMHAYQGWRSVVVISVLGMAYGGLAAWRKTLRIGMVAHAWQDVWSGWLSRAIAR
jgi:membrane protease YdiL (CAAX protease family)